MAQRQICLSWEIIRTPLGGMFEDTSPERSNRVMNAMLEMNKIDLKALQQAYEGR